MRAESVSCRAGSPRGSEMIASFWRSLDLLNHGELGRRGRPSLRQGRLAWRCCGRRRLPHGGSQHWIPISEDLGSRTSVLERHRSREVAVVHHSYAEVLTVVVRVADDSVVKLEGADISDLSADEWRAG